MKRVGKNAVSVCLVLIFLAGAGIFFYPSVSSRISRQRQSEAISEYTSDVSEALSEEYQKLWDDAAAYNETIGREGIHWHLTDEEKEEYRAKLDVDGTGMMSYITIPAIDCSLPIYHGVEESVLQVGAGHLEGSSLPVGGESSHCVLSGHNGLPTARLFTDLDQLAEGDTFELHTLGVTLTYVVDRISVVEPVDFSELVIEEGKDYCTLITCTPYGINSHRLLVRGCRTQSTDEPAA